MVGWILALLALLGLLLFGIAFFEPSTSNSQRSCSVGLDGVERCGPEMIDGDYRLPDSGTVVRAIVTNGAVSPESQVGYAITIDADGDATIVETTARSNGIGTPAPGTTDTRTVELGEDGLQELLRSIESCGFYGLPQVSELPANAKPVGGDVRLIDVTLDDGSWAVDESVLRSEFDRITFESCQGTITDWVGVPSIAA